MAENSDTPGNSGPSATLPDLGGDSFSSQGYDLIGNISDFAFTSNTTGDHYGDPHDTTTPDVGATEDSQPVAPLLGGMAGTPPLHALLDGSPAVDQIPALHCTPVSSGTNPHRLKECYRRVPELQRAAQLTVLSSLHCARLHLWDQNEGRLVGYRHLEALRSRA